MRRRFIIISTVFGLVGVALAIFLLLVRPAGRRVQAPVRWPTVLTALAGVGAPGLAEGRGHEAAFSDPFGVAVDNAGNSYLADAGDNNVVWRIEPDGDAKIVAGGREGFADGEGASASFDTPSAIALDAAGDLLVADTGNNAIRRVTRAGSVTTLAGNGEAGNADGRGPDARFNGPVGIALAPGGWAVVADTYNDCVRRVAPDGTVETIAGGGSPGFRDGAAGEALFDTPSGVAVDGAGVIYVADTGNNAVRRIARDGRVTTIDLWDPQAAGSHALWDPASAGLHALWDPASAGLHASDPSRAALTALFHPVGIAVTPAGTVFVSDGAGRVIAWSDPGGTRVLADRDSHLRNPTGLALAGDGGLRVADSDSYQVYRLSRPGDFVPASDIDFTPVPWLTAGTLGISAFPWPCDPQSEWHELAATLGEARGSLGGDGRERLHTGIDVRAPMGTVVRAVRDEKVERPVPAFGFGTANEMLRAGVVSYVHVRVGRTARAVPLDPARFTIRQDEAGEAVSVRIRRGTRLHVGDPIGTVNAFAHVHLALGPRESEINPLSLPLDQFRDSIPPTIVPAGIELYSETGIALVPPPAPSARRGRKRFPRPPVPVSGRVAIVVEAYDRVDGNGARRRLGVYRLGYQVLLGDGTPAPGFEQPLTTLEFDRLPDAAEAPHLIYAEGSGITVYGSKATRFRYIVTNSLREGQVTPGWWDTSALSPGDYVLRVFAADIAGNETTQDLAVRVVPALW